MELVVLGSAGWMPGGGRETTCLALRAGDSLLIFDAGTGLARLAQPGYRRLWRGSGPVHILLSHLHLDHTVGLTYLPALWRHRETIVHVPGEVLGLSPEVLDRLVGPPFFPHGFKSFPAPVRLCPITAGKHDLDGLQVEVRAQNHPGGSAGYRVGERLAFLTDTVFDPGAVDFVGGVRLLVHEAWIRGEEDSEELRRTLSAHTSAAEAARLARAAEVEELLLVHLNPLRGEAFLADMLSKAREIFPRTQLAYDGLARFL